MPRDATLRDTLLKSGKGIQHLRFTRGHIIVAQGVAPSKFHVQCIESRVPPTPPSWDSALLLGVWLPAGGKFSHWPVLSRTGLVPYLHLAQYCSARAVTILSRMLLHHWSMRTVRSQKISKASDTKGLNFSPECHTP